MDADAKIKQLEAKVSSLEKTQKEHAETLLKLTRQVDTLLASKR